jgi:hypothetical protein
VGVSGTGHQLHTLLKDGRDSVTSEIYNTTYSYAVSCIYETG